MAKLILKSPYLKCGGKEKVSGYLRYIATRERVQRIADDRPATQKQEQLITKLLRDFPDAKELLEYETWEAAHTKRAASVFISTALECNWSAVSRSDVYMKYIATRPRAERLGTHGLFGDGDDINLDKAASELDSYTGNVWTHILSLQREDAVRLGYDNAKAWRNLLRAHRDKIADAMQIPQNNFRWYAAFHDEGDHPHVHLMAWSSDPSQGYLTQAGIYSIRSALTNDIFKQEMLHLYEQKSESRDELVKEARRTMLELVRQMQTGIANHPEAEALMLELSQALETVKGKKSYGYLPKSVKALVNEIVDQMERLPVVFECYDRWLELQGQVDAYYTGEQRMRLKLSEQKEFRAVKNAVIQEAERIRQDTFTFEDAEPADAPEDEDYATNCYWTLKEIIQDETESLEERDNAVLELRKLADGGDVYAQYFLGTIYRDGGLLIPDPKLAIDWFYQAARQKLPVAQYQLGKLLLSDEAAIRDPPLGIEWLEMAKENGNAQAAYRLGKEYLAGTHVPQDAAKAVDCLTVSAKNGNQYAQYALGKLYLTGSVTKRDIPTAEHWFLRSAQQGNPYAQFFLDRMDSLKPTSVMLSTTRLLHHMSRIFQDNSLPKSSPMGMQIDRKRLQKLREKKIAMGHKPDDHEEYTGPTMSM